MRVLRVDEYGVLWIAVSNDELDEIKGVIVSGGCKTKEFGDVEAEAEDGVDSW